MKYSLNGTWKYIVDRADIGKKKKYYKIAWIDKMYDGLKSIKVPSNYNTIESLERYAGTIWYFTSLPEIPIQPKTYDYYIEFEGVNYIAEVWINGQYLGRHEGGFVPFKLKFSPRFFSYKFENYMAVRVDASFYRNGIPSDNTDWYNWGGIFRNVYLTIIPKSRLQNIRIDTKLPTRSGNKAFITISYKIKNTEKYLEECYIQQVMPQVNYELYYSGRFFGGLPQFNRVLIQTGSQEVNPEVQGVKKIKRTKEAVELFFKDVLEEIEGIQSQKSLDSLMEGMNKEEKGDESKDLKRNNVSAGARTVEDIENSILITINNPSLWSPDNPELYELIIGLNGSEEKEIIRFGIRQIQVRGTNIYLNHHPIKLRGISLHEELLPYGRTYPVEERRRDILRMRAMGFNALRTAHYPHDSSILDIADEEGMLIFEEIPNYWDCNFKNVDTLKLAVKTLHDMIWRDINHPSIITWSVGNEIPTEQISTARAVRILMDIARKIDDTRIVTYVSNRFAADPLRDQCDICCENAYFGWYLGSVYNLNFMLDSLYHTMPNKPWVITEFGAGAKFGLHDPALKFSEENQARIISYTINVLNSKPYIAGWFIWIYRDFKSHLRLNPYQQGFNRKGLVSEKNEEKLIARLMPHIINKRLKPGQIRHYRGLAHMFSYILRPIEKVFYGVFAPLIYNLARRALHKFYDEGIKSEK